MDIADVLRVMVAEDECVRGSQPARSGLRRSAARGLNRGVSNRLLLCIRTARDCADISSQRAVSYRQGFRAATPVPLRSISFLVMSIRS